MHFSQVIHSSQVTHSSQFIHSSQTPTAQVARSSHVVRSSRLVDSPRVARSSPGGRSSRSVRASRIAPAARAGGGPSAFVVSRTEVGIAGIVVAVARGGAALLGEAAANTNRLTPRDAYYTLGSLWAFGGCIVYY